MDANFTRRQETIREVLTRAVLDGDLPVLRTLFRASSSSQKLRSFLDAAEFDSFTALQRACISRNPELVGLLLDQGVNIEARGKYDWTALHVAAWISKRESKILKILLNSFANVLARDSHGCLPIDLASDTDTRRLLISEMEKRGALQLAELYTKIEDDRSATLNLDGQSKEKVGDALIMGADDSDVDDYLEMDSDESLDENGNVEFQKYSPQYTRKESALRNWKSNLVVSGENSSCKHNGIKRHSQVSESSISLISEVSSAKSRDSGVYCDGDDDTDLLAASFQEGVSCLSRWEPYYDLSSVSP